MSTFVPVNPVNPDVAGVAVIVQDPEDGNPLNATLPVAKAQVGCVMVPTVGAEGKAFTTIVPLAKSTPGHEPFNGIL